MIDRQVLALLGDLAGDLPDGCLLHLGILVKLLLQFEDLRFLDFEIAGQNRARKRDDHFVAGFVILGAAHDLARLPFAGVDLADGQAVCVGVVAGLQNPGNPQIRDWRGGWRGVFLDSFFGV